MENILFVIIAVIVFTCFIDGVSFTNMSQQARRTVGTNAGLDYIGVHNFIQGFRINEMNEQYAADLMKYNVFSLTDTASGPFAAPEPQTIDITQVGRLVTLTMGFCLANATVSAILTFDTLIPAEFRPVGQDASNSVTVRDDNISLHGRIVVFQSGAVTVSMYDPTTGQAVPFSGTAISGTTGVPTVCSCTWIV